MPDGQEEPGIRCCDRKYFSELVRLEGDVGGRQVMDRYRERIRIVETDAEELIDVDRREDLESL